MLDQLSACSASKHGATRLLSSLLEAGPAHLAGPRPTLADLAGLSVARTLGIATPSVTKWVARCAQAGYKQ